MNRNPLNFSAEEIDELIDTALAMDDAREYRFDQINLNQIQTVEHFNYRVPTNPATREAMGDPL